MASWRTWGWWLAVAVMLVSAVSIVRDLPFESLVLALRGWIEGLGYWGPLALVALYVVATVLFVPGTLLTLVAGGVFGLGVGMLAVSIGSTLGACAAFLIARYLARKKVAALAGRNRHFGAIDQAIAEGGWKVVGLLRLSPAIPFNLQNYLYGLTAVGFWPYAITSWIAMLPGTFLYVYIGHLTGAALGGERQRTVGEWVLLGVGLLATLAVTVYITRLARSKLQQQVGTQADSKNEQSTHDEKKGSAGVAWSLWAMLAASALILLLAIYVHMNAQSLDSWLKARLAST